MNKKTSSTVSYIQYPGENMCFDSFRNNATIITVVYIT